MQVSTADFPPNTPPYTVTKGIHARNPPKRQIAKRHPSSFGFSIVLLLQDELLGNGTYGMVHVQTQSDNLLLCARAAKILHPLQHGAVASEANIGSLEREGQRLCSVRHPNIVQYLGTHVGGPTSLAILMELKGSPSSLHLIDHSSSRNCIQLRIHFSFSDNLVPGPVHALLALPLPSNFIRHQLSHRECLTVDSVI